MADAPDLNQISALTDAQKANTASFLGGQNAETADFLKRYTGAITAQPSMSALATRIGGELGLPQLQANSQSLQNTLFNLPSTYSKATTGYDVNANQLARIIGQKQSEIAPAASLAQSNLQNAQNTLTTRLGYEQADQNKQLLPYQTEQNLLSDRLARETTLFSQDNQRELDGLITKINAGITLSEGEKNRAQQLALAEQSYQNQLKLQQNQQSQPNFVGVNGGLYNTTNSTWAVKPPLSAFLK